jgi:hypothetical protein
MYSKIIIAFALSAAFAVPAMASATISGSHSQCRGTVKCATVHATHGATVSHGGAAIAKKPH